MARMPLGRLSGSARSEEGSEAFLEGMGNSFIVDIIHPFFSSPQLSPVPRPVGRERACLSKSALWWEETCALREVGRAPPWVGQAWAVGQAGDFRQQKFEWGPELPVGIAKGRRKEGCFCRGDRMWLE